MNILSLLPFTQLTDFFSGWQAILKTTIQVVIYLFILAWDIDTTWYELTISIRLITWPITSTLLWNKPESGFYLHFIVHFNTFIHLLSIDVFAFDRFYGQLLIAVWDWSLVGRCWNLTSMLFPRYISCDRNNNTIIGRLRITLVTFVFLLFAKK